MPETTDQLVKKYIEKDRFQATRIIIQNFSSAQIQMKTHQKYAFSLIIYFIFNANILFSSN